LLDTSSALLKYGAHFTDKIACRNNFDREASPNAGRSAPQSRVATPNVGSALVMPVLCVVFLRLGTTKTLTASMLCATGYYADKESEWC
jgi:hypothetical protein